MESRGKTILVVHHALRTVPLYFDHVAMINRRLIAAGSVRDVFTEENIEKLFSVERSLTMEPAAFFALPLWRDYTFQIVLAGTTILGVLCGVVGSFIVLRREALLGDGISHSSYPGIMLAFLFLGVKTLEGLLLGAFLSALAALSLILLARHYTKLPFDGVLASILSSFSARVSFCLPSSSIQEMPTSLD